MSSYPITIGPDGTFSTFFPTIGESGNKTVRVTATDYNEHATIKTRTVYDSAKGPYLEITSPANLSDYHSLVTVTGIIRNSLTPGSGLSNVKLLNWVLLGNPAETDTLMAPDDPPLPPPYPDWNFSFDVDMKYMTGSQTVRLTAVDEGDKTTEIDLTLTNDGEAPTVTIGYPSDGYYYQPGGLTVTGNVFEPAGIGEINTDVGSLRWTLSSSVQSGNFTIDGSGNYSFGIDTDVLTTDHILTVHAEDWNGNEHEPFMTILKDTSDPEVVDVFSTNPNDEYHAAGENIVIKVQFSETINLISTPGNTELTLATGGPSPVVDDPTLATTSVSDDTLVFTYVVQIGDDEIADLDYVGVGSLDATIEDVYGNDWDGTLPAPGASGSLSHGNNIAIDGTKPTVVQVYSIPSPATYGIGDVVPIYIEFHEPVDVTGTPQLWLETGTTDRYADCTHTPGSYAEILTFEYIVQEGDVADDLQYKNNDALTGVIFDRADQPYTENNGLPTTSDSDSLGLTSAIKVDGVRPIVSNVRDTASGTTVQTFGIGEEIEIKIVLNENITVVGGATLELDTGNPDTVTYPPFAVFFEAGPATVTFTYTVQEGDDTTGLGSPGENDLDYTDEDALSTDIGARVTDLAGNLPGPLVPGPLPAPTSDGSLSENETLRLDGVRPAIISAETRDTNADGWINRLVVEFDEVIGSQTFDPADFTISAGDYVDSVNTGGSTSDGIIRIELDEGMIADSVLPTLSIALGSVVGDNGNGNGVITDFPSMDGVKPYLVSLVTADINPVDGDVDTLVATFDDVIPDQMFTSGDFTLPGGETTVSGVDNGVSLIDEIIHITLTAQLGEDVTPLLDIASDAVEDDAGNFNSLIENFASTDGVGPD